MARMVYIQQINPATFLHLSTSEPAGFCLRDYSIGPNVKPVVSRQTQARTLADIRQMLVLPGNHDYPAPDGQNVERLDFWHTHTKQLNKRYGIGEKVITHEVLREILVGSVVALVAAVIAIVSYKFFGVKPN